MQDKLLNLHLVKVEKEEAVETTEETITVEVIVEITEVAVETVAEAIAETTTIAVVVDVMKVLNHKHLNHVTA
jgi:hypothetical protein